VSALLVLSAMPASHRCPYTALSIPECCCAECCRGLLWRYAPALVDAGPLETPCPVLTPAIRTVESYARAHGVSESELRRPASRLEVQI
jgi:hypothetical protein